LVGAANTLAARIAVARECHEKFRTRNHRAKLTSAPAQTAADRTLAGRTHGMPRAPDGGMLTGPRPGAPVQLRMRECHQHVYVQSVAEVWERSGVVVWFDWTLGYRNVIRQGEFTRNRVARDGNREKDNGAVMLDAPIGTHAVSSREAASAASADAAGNAAAW
jgi:hypothetical protein